MCQTSSYTQARRPAVTSFCAIRPRAGLVPLTRPLLHQLEAWSLPASRAFSAPGSTPMSDGSSLPLASPMSTMTAYGSSAMPQPLVKGPASPTRLSRRPSVRSPLQVWPGYLGQGFSHLLEPLPLQEKSGYWGRNSSQDQAPLSLTERCPSWAVMFSTRPHQAPSSLRPSAQPCQKAARQQSGDDALPKGGRTHE
jgi:hypothetical protein